MTRDKKITDKQLKKEIKNNQSLKKIASRYGYSFPSQTLRDRAEKLGYRKNYIAKVRKQGGANVYIPRKVLEKADVEFVEKEDSKAIAYSFHNSDEGLALKMHSDHWRKINK